MFLKAGLFAVGWALCGVMLMMDQAGVKTVLLFTVASWCIARAYYFVFYGAEHYVGAGWKYAGVWGIVRTLIQRHKGVAQNSGNNEDRKDV